MKNIILIFTLFLLNNISAQNIVGKWKCIANYTSFDNKKTKRISTASQSNKPLHTQTAPS